MTSVTKLEEAARIIFFFATAFAYALIEALFLHEFVCDTNRQVEQIFRSQRDSAYKEIDPLRRYRLTLAHIDPMDY